MCFWYTHGSCIRARPTPDLVRKCFKVELASLQCWRFICVTGRFIGLIIKRAQYPSYYTEESFCPWPVKSNLTWLSSRKTFPSSSEFLQRVIIYFQDEHLPFGVLNPVQDMPLCSPQSHILFSILLNRVVGDYFSSPGIQTFTLFALRSCASSIT